MGATKNILVVDDDPDFRESMQSILEAAGYAVRTAFDSIEAEALAKEQAPDLILLDVIMEEVDAGFVFAERFGAEYPVVLLSTVADSSIKVFDVHKLPVRGILQKPVPPDALLETVRTAIGG